MRKLLHNAVFLASLNGVLLFALIHLRCMPLCDKFTLRVFLSIYAALYVYQMKKLLSRKTEKHIFGYK